MSRAVFIPGYFVLATLIFWTLPQEWIVALILGTGFPHVLLGIKYSKRRMEAVWTQPWMKSFLVLLIPASLVMGFSSWGMYGLILYFGLHHALSEAFAHRREGFESLHYQPWVFLLTLVTYLFVCREDVFTTGVPVWLGAAWISVILSSWLLIAKNRSVPMRRVLEGFPWILGSIACIGMSFYRPIPWENFILFHFVFWGMLPLFRKNMFRDNETAKRQFWKDAVHWNGVGLASMSILTIWSGLVLDFRFVQFLLLVFYALTYWHITSAFVVSGANPNWIKRIFSA